MLIINRVLVFSFVSMKKIAFLLYSFFGVVVFWCSCFLCAFTEVSIRRPFLRAVGVR